MAGADLDLIHDLMVGPFVYRRLFTGGRIDDELVRRLPDTVLSAFGSATFGGEEEETEA